MKMILSAFADEYADSFAEQLQALKRFGIGYIELRHVDGKNISALNGEEFEQVKAMLDAAEIQVSAIGSPIGKITLDGDLAGHFEMAERVFAMAQQLGAKYVRVFSFYPPKGEEIRSKRAEVLALLEKLIRLAEKYDVILCHENEAKIYGSTPEACRDLLDHFGGALKCVFDMGNFVLEGVAPYPSAYELLKKDIAYFHIKDALFEGAIVPPGKGEAKIGEILAAHAADAKEPFFVSLEPHLQTFSGLNALAGRFFENPYQYEDAASAFTDAVEKLREVLA
ncbi:MAG: sugar phosphate isomerase/epimerase [Clostridia bacterium]|nr:sugar phosphate isomerase/epimerase [Clostridia bacterium]